MVPCKRREKERNRNSFLSHRWQAIEREEENTSGNEGRLYSTNHSLEDFNSFAHLRHRRK